MSISLRTLGIAIGVGVFIAASIAGESNAAVAPKEHLQPYPTTCQWNGCPVKGSATCLSAWEGHYICTGPVWT